MILLENQYRDGLHMVAIISKSGTKCACNLGHKSDLIWMQLWWQYPHYKDAIISGPPLYWYYFKTNIDIGHIKIFRILSVVGSRALYEFDFSYEFSFGLLLQQFLPTFQHLVFSFWFFYLHDIGPIFPLLRHSFQVSLDPTLGDPF